MDERRGASRLVDGAIDRPLRTARSCWFALLLVSGAAAAPDPPPAGMRGLDEAAWWMKQCSMLGLEAAEIDARQEDFESLDRAADRLSAAVQLPNGESMYARLQQLERETRTAPNEAARRRANDEHVALYAEYVGRMDRLVAGDPDLGGKRGMRSFQAMIARHDEVSTQWEAVRDRQPKARSERDRACAAFESSAETPLAPSDASPASCAAFRRGVEERDATCRREERYRADRANSTTLAWQRAEADVRDVQLLRRKLNCNGSFEKADHARCNASSRELARLFALQDAMAASGRRADAAPSCAHRAKTLATIAALEARCAQADAQRTRSR